MDVSTIIDSLNDAQREAVTLPSCPALVLAGAGSGKTRVLVHRIAWLSQVEGIALDRQMAVTFTNKAAAEMRGRVEKLLNVSARPLWIGTFHGIAHRLLRRHAAEARLPDAFQILDADDQYRLIRRLLKSLNLDEARWPPRQVQWFINGQKDEGHRPQNIPQSGDEFQDQMVQLYSAYEAICQRSGLVDFAELLLRAHELLRDNPALLEHYQSRFTHILADEFQDTNTIQYAWLRLLAGKSGTLFVVGDDDQSIYGWRGARMDNLQRFCRHYPTHQLVMLEQNYRSSATILKAANSLITQNQNRMGKKLWTDGNEGEPIALYEAFNEQDEAYFVIDRIKQWIDDGNSSSEAAILYRSNAQSRQFEERLIQNGVPYTIYGGIRFFERVEIKDALAYLRLVANRDDDASFERVVNTPTRGIGGRTMDHLRQIARAQQTTLWRAATLLCSEKQLSARASNALQAFLDLINRLEHDINPLQLSDQCKQVIEKSALIPHYQKEGEKGETRIDNLKELVNAARQYEYQEGDSEDELSILQHFLAQAALEAGDQQADDSGNSVQLMTLHSAKGLEFQLVFLVGMEEGLFPGERSIEEPGRLEEERRLCYVGITRAKQKLFLSCAESRRRYGRELYPRPSRFIAELPQELIREVRLQNTSSRPGSTFSNTAGRSAVSNNSTGFVAGQRVNHAKFGEGTVLQSEGEGGQARIQINFETVGMKWLVVGYAKLQPVG